MVSGVNAIDVAPFNISSSYYNDETQTQSATRKIGNTTITCPGYFGRDISRQCTKCKYDFTKSKWYHNPPVQSYVVMMAADWSIALYNDKVKMDIVWVVMMMVIEIPLTHTFNLDIASFVITMVSLHQLFLLCKQPILCAIYFKYEIIIPAV